MNAITWKVLQLSILLLLSACHGPHGFMHRPLTPCETKCEQQLSQCVKSCDDSCRKCKAVVSARAHAAYFYYTHEEEIKSGYIIRDLKSYKDPLQCHKTTCACPADYAVCMSGCQGVIFKQLRVADTSCD